MGCKLVNCDCRQPGFPRHTHTHPLDADGKMMQGQDKEPGPGIWPFSPAKGKTPKRPFRHWPLVWLIVGLALLAVKVWFEWHQKVEVELPMTTTIADTVALFEEAKEAQPYLYFELGWTRATGWMCWLQDRTGGGKVNLCVGQDEEVEDAVLPVLTTLRAMKEPK